MEPPDQEDVDVLGAIRIMTGPALAQPVGGLRERRRWASLRCRPTPKGGRAETMINEGLRERGGLLRRTDVLIDMESEDILEGWD